jgi:hypothetical protein
MILVNYIDRIPIAAISVGVRSHSDSDTAEPNEYVPSYASLQQAPSPARGEGGPASDHSPLATRPVHEHPVVAPHVSHFRHVPFLTSVKFWHSPQASPT